MRCIGRALLHRLGDHLQPCFHGQWRHPRGPCLVALKTGHALIKIPLLPPPDRGLRRICAAHDLERAVTIRRRKNDLGSPDKLARRVAVGDQGLKLCAVSGAKVKANVGASHAPNMAD